MKKPEDIFNVESNPELPSPDDDDDGDKEMPQARTTGKRSGADRSDPPTTPAKKRPSSGSTSLKWWVDLAPLAVERSTTAWHTELIDALLAEWSDSNMTRLQQWFSTHATEEMQATLDSLSTANTTKRALHSGLRTLLRGACIPPLIFSAHAPKSTQGSSSTSLNDNLQTCHSKLKPASYHPQSPAPFFEISCGRSTTTIRLGPPPHPPTACTECG